MEFLLIGLLPTTESKIDTHYSKPDPIQKYVEPLTASVLLGTISYRDIYHRVLRALHRPRFWAADLLLAHPEAHLRT